MPRRPTCPRLCKRGVHAVIGSGMCSDRNQHVTITFRALVIFMAFTSFRSTLGRPCSWPESPVKRSLSLGCARPWVLIIQSNRIDPVPCPSSLGGSSQHKDRICGSSPASALNAGEKGMERVSLAAGFQPTNDGALHDAFANASPYIYIYRGSTNTRLQLPRRLISRSGQLDWNHMTACLPAWLAVCFALDVCSQCYYRHQSRSTSIEIDLEAYEFTCLRYSECQFRVPGHFVAARCTPSIVPKITLCSCCCRWWCCHEEGMPCRDTRPPSLSFS